MKILILLFVLFFSQGVFAQTSFSMSERCSEISETREMRIYEEQAIGRTDWASKCFPHLKSMLDENGKLFMKSSGQKRVAYPFIVLVDEDYEFLDYFVAPLSDEEPCLDEKRYAIGGFCASLEKPKPVPDYLPGDYPMDCVKKNNGNTAKCIPF